MKAEDFNRIIMDCWESIAYVAFDGFHRLGRGVVDLMEEKKSMEQCYVVYEKGKPDHRSSRLIAEYDPAWEVLVQYLQAGGSSLILRIRTRPEQRHPWLIWVRNRIIEDNK